MTIELTHKRKTKNNDYKRYFITQGLLCWYVRTNKGVITNISETFWDIEKDDIVYEKQLNELPKNVLAAFNNYVS